MKTRWGLRRLGKINMINKIKNNMLSKKNKFNELNFDGSNLNHIYYREFDGEYLLTNDFGGYIFLSPEEFKKVLENKLSENSDLYKRLYRKMFIKKDLTEMSDEKEELRNQKASIFSGPSLHIIVTTLRCNYNCIYCQARAQTMDDDGLDMTIDTAKKTVDRIFETNSDVITIEFQGGEPLANWDVIKFVVEYAREKEEKSDKEVKFSVVSNLSLLDEKKFNFLTKNVVGVCTSLDGPKKVHNKNRPYAKGDSYEETVNWILKYQLEFAKRERSDGTGLTKINALVTISKFSLDYHKEIIDEYVKFGFHAVHLRPLSFLGYSGMDFQGREKMGYDMEEFLEFWKKSIDYLVELNEDKDIHFFDRGVRIMLRKILVGKDPGYTDLSSPCGAAIGQVLYDYDGSIYTCDEGRMIGDDTFKIGDVRHDSYEDVLEKDNTKATISASILEGQSCSLCVYKPYCGVCPVKNYKLHGTLFPQMKNTDWCKLKKEQFNYIFEKLKEDGKHARVFNRWVDKYKSRIHTKNDN